MLSVVPSEASVISLDEVRARKREEIEARHPSRYEDDAS